jgi:ferric-dicitrate binding protein FerR (iron transport regulator)
MSDREPSDSRALAQLAALLRDAPNAPTPSELDRGLAKVRSRLSERRAQPSDARRWAWRGALAVLCVILVTVTATWLRPAPPLAHRAIALNRMEGGQLLQGGYLSETGAQGIRLFFDEGSQLALTPGGRGRLRVDASTGVRLLLERGSASLQITPTPEPRWSVESGPFLVKVKGTDFTVGWDPTSELFELTLHRGRVVVSGPVVGDDFVVRPGQKLSVSLPKAESVISEERSFGAAPPTPSSTAPVAKAAASAEPATAADGGANGTGGATSAASPAASSHERKWRGALGNGEWDRIIAEAERGGIEATLAAAPSDDLFALADAARYRRRLDLAQAALLAQRRRFPGSPRAPEAIFLLGRVSELRSAGGAAALRYYDQYLVRAPSGTYAAEALGRKMTLVNEAGGGARSIAEEYLRRFPEGSYAGAARSLLSAGE